MDEILNVVNDTQVPVVEAQESAQENGGAQSALTEVTAREQSRQENASFRKMRLENERLREENERLTGDAIERKMAEDLSLIQSMDESVTSLEELGEEFACLIAAGISAPVAFAAINEAKRAAMPPTMGQLSGSGKGEKTFYSPQEVDALSADQLADPQIWERVRESMTRW